MTRREQMRWAQAHRVVVNEADRILRRPAVAEEIARELAWWSARGDVRVIVASSDGGRTVGDVLMTPAEALAAAARFADLGARLYAEGVREDPSDWSPSRRRAAGLPA